VHGKGGGTRILHSRWAERKGGEEKFSASLNFTRGETAKRIRKKQMGREGELGGEVFRGAPTWVANYCSTEEQKSRGSDS